MGDSKIYNSIMTGIQEAIDDAKSDKPVLNRHKVIVEPIKEYKPSDIKRIRKSTGMSQNVFASYMGVSGKTVEAWESGTNHPSGAASRLLNMMEMDSNLIVQFPFVSKV